MKRLTIAFLLIGMSAATAYSAEDPIAVRKALMDANGSAAGLAAGMMKGEIDYNPTIAKASIVTMHGVAMAYGDYFPEESMDGDTTAAPAIWEDSEGFQAALDKFKSDTAAALEAAGKDGPADLETFQAAIQPVLGNCRSCHEDFRKKQ